MTEQHFYIFNDADVMKLEEAGTFFL